MRRAAFLLSLLGIASASPAQAALFFRDQNLAAVPPVHQDLAVALQAVCAGPDASQRAMGYTSHVPPGTRLLAVRRHGKLVELLFDDTLLQAAAGCQLEHALEQLQKTAGNAPGVTDVRVLLRDAAGSEQDLGERLGRKPGSATPPPRSSAAPALTSTGALSGRRIAISPGHGFYWHSTLGWTTQRGAIDGLIEDLHTAEICNHYLIPMLRDLGADVVLTREPGELPFDGLVDNDQGAPRYVETGSWSLSASSGYGNSTYRFVGSSPVGTATATWTIPVQAAGLYPVFVWFRAGSNRSTAAQYTIFHTGGSTTVTADQTRDNLTWVHLGNFWFEPIAGARIVLSNQGSAAGVVIADAARLGGGLGSIVRGGSTSNRRRWQEAARYWAQFAGAPASVYDSVATGQDSDDDVTARPRFAEWRTADAFVSLHTNAGGGAGTETYVYSTAPTAGSTNLQARVHNQLIADLRAEWNAGWTDRGLRSANFGELRLLSTMPGILVELAFHDTAGSLDHRSLHHPRFRYLAARAIARGVLRHFDPLAPFPPEPPSALRVMQDGARGLRVAWDAVAGATGYVVEQSADGKGFVPVATTTATSWSTGPLPHDSLWSFRVRATNGSGRSMPTEVLTAGTDHLATAQVLLVQGFDRLDRFVNGPDNTGDYLRLYGAALRHDANRSRGFDAASNEAVRLGRVILPGYRAVVWSLGEESTADETFDATEQALVTGYLAAGGRLLVTGSEVGWDLDANGSAADRSFFRNVLGATYVADDAGVYTLQPGLPGTVSDGLPASGFDDGNGGTYDVDFPDVLAPTAGLGGAVCLRYGNGLAAGVQRIDANSGARVIVLGLPLETILDAGVRAQLLQQCIGFLLPDEPLRGPATSRLGQRLQLQLTLPGDAGRPYLCFVSDAIQPPIPLPRGGLLPLRPGFLLDASVDPGSTLFGNFVGTLSPSASAAPFVDVPYLPLLVGQTFFFAACSLDTQVVAERQVSNWVRCRLTW